MNNIHFYRNKNGFTQEKLSELVDVHVNTVIRWESGERDPRASDIQKLAQAFNITENELLNGAPDEN